MDHHVEQPAPEPAQLVLPDKRLLFVLVVVLLSVAIGLIARWGGDGDGGQSLAIGRLEDVVLEMTSDPLVIAELPGIVVTRGTIDPTLTVPRWGESDGSLALDRTAALFALSLRDPADRSTLVWCPAAGRFEHRDGERTYGVDGRLLSGDGPRGMDRRAIIAGAGGQVVIDPSRWVAGLPVSGADAIGRPPRATCTGETATTDS